MQDHAYTSDVARNLYAEAKTPSFRLLRIYIEGLTEVSWLHLAPHFEEYHAATRFGRVMGAESSVVLFRQIRLERKEDFRVLVETVFRCLHTGDLERVAVKATYHQEDSGTAIVWSLELA